jgi:E3 ubiquitin-protein ligase MYCBP2
LRQPDAGLRCPTLWLAGAALCVLHNDHVEGLSSGEWGAGGNGQTDRPVCDNHDDGETLAIILCDTCGNLCSDCDRFLHLHRKTRHHGRQVFKEEEEAMKVNLHEGCGRAKLFWLTAAADSATLKGMIEFKDEGGAKKGGSGFVEAVCRYCGGFSCAAMPVLHGVCTQPDCQEYSRLACTKNLDCGHPCGGITGETQCLPCLKGCDAATSNIKQDGDDMCMICFTEPLSPIPCIRLECNHIFHYSCVRGVLKARWYGPRITFGFIQCPICKAEINHVSLTDLLQPIKLLYEDVKKKALMRLEYEGLSRCEALTTEGARWFNNATGFALYRYAYYVCFKCNKAYFGGEARCDQEAGVGDVFNPEELVCGGCSDVSQAQMCPKHGTDYLEYKCRYCCSVAVFFCFGTTHFCNACHDDFQRVVNIPKTELPQCPVAPKAISLDGEECPLHVKHPATGEEFALGCGICRNAHTF